MGVKLNINAEAELAPVPVSLADAITAAQDAATATAADRIAVAADKVSSAASATSASGSASSAEASATSASGSASGAAVSATSASGSASSAAASATSASGSASGAASSASGALSSLTSLLAKWLGVSAADPTQDGAGNPLVDGALYFSSAVMRLKARVAGAWVIAVNTILSTSGAPSSGAGVDGDFAIDSSAGNLYGPKAGGAWPAAKSLVGAPSSPGGSDGNVQFKSGVNFAGSDGLFWDNLNGRLGIGTSTFDDKDWQLLAVGSGSSAFNPVAMISKTIDPGTSGASCLYTIGSFNPSADTAGEHFGAISWGDTTSGNTANFTAADRGLVGQYVVARHRGTGTITAFDGIRTWLRNTSSGTITNAAGLNIPSLANTGTITNTYGVYVGDITTGTQTNTPYSFYASDANAYNYFAGKVGIGTATPAVILDVDGPICVKSYTVATVPSAAAKAGQQIYVSNEVGGGVIAFADGTNWRRCTDLAIISA
ncbi:MAG: hypothetical protein FJX45_10385 [Alphaproteobacteria bacterium]|nr:hypothetical protein [Alphaproteobacteria bacterium]